MKKFFGIFSVVAFVLTWTVSAKNLNPFYQREDTFNIKSSFDGNPRIINGNQAALGQFPEQAFLIGYTDPLGISEMYYCGGVIVNADWVLTAAHCVDVSFHFGIPVLSIKVQVGFVDRNNPGPTQQSILVVNLGNIYPHSNYNPTTLENDIGLIRVSSLLSSGFDLSGPNAKAANLLSRSLDMDDYVGKDLTISGFGSTTGTGGNPSTILYTAVIQVITYADCQMIYDYLSYSIPSTCFCGLDSTAPISSTCQGDSGGPASIMIGTTRTVVGLVSFGSGSCGASAQGFTDLSQFIGWINQYI